MARFHGAEEVVVRLRHAQVRVAKAKATFFSLFVSSGFSFRAGFSSAPELPGFPSPGAVPCPCFSSVTTVSL